MRFGGSGGHPREVDEVRREQSRASKMRENRSQQELDIRRWWLDPMSSVCPSTSFTDLKETKNWVINGRAGGIRDGGVGNVLVRINISSVET